MNATNSVQPLGKTVFGVTVWPVPGQPGQHLTWGGPGDHVRLCKKGSASAVGSPARTVGELCQTLAEAQQAVDAYLATETTEG